MKNFIIKHKIPIMLVFSGLLSALPLIFTALGFLQWVSFVPAALALILSAEDKSTKFRKLYGRGLLFFWSYYAVTFHWFFYMYPLDFAGLNNAASIVVVLVACFGLSLLQALWSALAFLIFGAAARTDIVKKCRLLLPFLGASVWVLAEWFQTQGWWGVPWGRIPLGQMSAPILVRSSSLFGSYFVTFIIVSVNFCVAFAILNKGSRRLTVSLAVGLFCLNLALGAVVTLAHNENDGRAVTVAAAQGNISSSEKWDYDSLNKTLKAYEKLTEQAAVDGADIVVWPETALPYELFGNEELTYYVKRLACENEITILASAFTEDRETGQLYNSIIEVRPDGSFGEKVYSKQRLVPFGEFVPMRDVVMFLIPPLAEVGMLEDDLLAGEESVVLETEIGRVGCGICFDSIYENIMLGGVRNGAEIIAVSTNDSWFSDSAALDMHNSQSRLRAIESGRYVVRSANTGISSIIDPMGNVIDELGALRSGVIVAEVYMRDNVTLYSVIGNLWVLLCAVFVVLPICYELIIKAKKMIFNKF
jgi:apolipoprotein N-acyltransferase